MAKNREYYDVAIIGGGAGGLTAGIYCGRAGLKTIIFEKSLPGGLATYTREIENYPGFPEGISGTELMKGFEKQAKKFGAKIKLTAIEAANLTSDEKIVSTFRTDYISKAVVIASGGKPRLTGAKGEESFLYDKGISFCATCDAAYYSGKSVLVIGSGDAAIEEAVFLAKFSRRVQVSVIHDAGILDANEIAKKHAFANPRIKFIWNTMVEEFKGEESLQQVVLKNVKTGNLTTYNVDGCFLFIGYIPDTDLFKGQIEMNQRGYIVTNETMETNLEGVFAVGDVRDKGLRQVATAVGDGAIGGTAVERYLALTSYFEQQLLEDNKPTLVYCWNPIDPFCHSLMSSVEKIKDKYNETLKVVVVDMYKNENIAKKLGLTQAPTLALLHNGKVCYQTTECIEEIDHIEEKISEISF